MSSVGTESYVIGVSLARFMAMNMGDQELVCGVVGTSVCSERRTTRRV